MLLIVYSGWGFLVLLMVGPASALMIVLDQWLHLGFFMSFIPTLLLWGSSVIVLGTMINSSSKDRLVIDHETGQGLTIKSRSTLYWVPMQYWGWLILALGIYLAVNSFDDIRKELQDFRRRLVTTNSPAQAA